MNQAIIRNFIDNEAKAHGLSQSRYLALPAAMKMRGRSPMEFIGYLVSSTTLNSEGIQDLLGVLGWNSSMWEEVHSELIEIQIDSLRAGDGIRNERA